MSNLWAKETLDQQNKWYFFLNYRFCEHLDNWVDCSDPKCLACSPVDIKCGGETCAKSVEKEKASLA